MNLIKAEERGDSHIWRNSGKKRCSELRNMLKATQLEKGIISLFCGIYRYFRNHRTGSKAAFMLRQRIKYYDYGRSI